jgi:hypothetical protein
MWKFGKRKSIGFYRSLAYLTPTLIHSLSWTVLLRLTNLVPVLAINPSSFSDPTPNKTASQMKEFACVNDDGPEPKFVDVLLFVALCSTIHNGLLAITPREVSYQLSFNLGRFVS